MVVVPQIMELVDLVVDILLPQAHMLVVVLVDSHPFHLVDNHLVMVVLTPVVAEVEVETIQMESVWHMDILVVPVLFSSHIHPN